MNNEYDEGIDLEIKAFDSAVKKGSRSFAKNLPSVIAVFCVLVTAVFIFTDIKLKELLSVSFAGEALLILTMFYMMYLSMNENGIRAGRTDKGYIASREDYLSARQKARKYTRAEIEKFCSAYVINEQRSTREKILMKANLTYEYWEKNFTHLEFSMKKSFISGKVRSFRLACTAKEQEAGESERLFAKLSPSKKRAVIKACMLKPLELTYDMLMYEDSERVYRHPISPSVEKSKMRRNTKGLVGITLTAFLVVSITGSIIKEPTLTTLVYGMLKICSLLFAGFKGYAQGLLLYTSDAYAYNESRVNLLDEITLEK